MHKLYKEDVSNMNWHLNNDYQIKKREVGDQEYEFQVQFSARQDIDKTDGSKVENKFKIRRYRFARRERFLLSTWRRLPQNNFQV